MVAGSVFIRGTFWGFLFYGFSHQHLWFSSKGDETIAMRSGDTRAAWRCTRCGTMAVFPIAPPREKPHFEALFCFALNEKMRHSRFAGKAGHGSVAESGWSVTQL
jgi:hypothetical protein